MGNCSSTSSADNKIRNKHNKKPKARIKDPLEGFETPIITRGSNRDTDVKYIKKHSKTSNQKQ